jgi:hypothetical protein
VPVRGWKDLLIYNLENLDLDRTGDNILAAADDDDGRVRKQVVTPQNFLQGL